MIRKKLDIVGRALNGVEETLKTIKTDASEISRETLETLQPFIEQQRQKELKSPSGLIEHSLTAPVCTINSIELIMLIMMSDQGAMISSFSNNNRSRGLSGQIIMDNNNSRVSSTVTAKRALDQLEKVEDEQDGDNSHPTKRFKPAY